VDGTQEVWTTPLTFTLGNAVTQIKMVPVQFTGGLRYDYKGHLHRNVDSSIDYVGAPSDEVDEAWDALIRGTEPLPSIQKPFSPVKVDIHHSPTRIITVQAASKPSTRTESCIWGEWTRAFAALLADQP
jgi:hypothetical protein